MQKQILFFLLFGLSLSPGAHLQAAKLGLHRAERGGASRLDLTAEERTKLHDAREKALRDPKVAAAWDDKKTVSQELREVTRAALVKEDASLGPILEKSKSQGRHRRDVASGTPAPDSEAKPGDEHPEEGRGRFANLSNEERQKVQTAMRKIRSNPEVAAAHERKIQADRTFRDALHSAMLAADPSIDPLLKKVESQLPGRARGKGASI